MWHAWKNVPKEKKKEPYAFIESSHRKKNLCVIQLQKEGTYLPTYLLTYLPIYLPT
jgi:hypothetical protein